MSETPKEPQVPLEVTFTEFCNAWFAGERPNLEEFCNRSPECGPELLEKIENLLFVEQGLSDVGMRDDNSYSDKSINNDVTTGEILGDFKIYREIGRGGMGTVYEAEQCSLNRRVALKILPAHLTISDQSVKKFYREAEAGGRHSHPGIVSIYTVGEHEGRHFIAQELIEGGRTLADKINERRAEKYFPSGYFRVVARLIAKVADALEHAHALGVIHRDVKPSNILLTEDEDPKVSDFGLAKLEDALSLSRSDEFAGTPYYMSPEQALSHRTKINHRTDIYSLGVTLYEMLTLHRPFEATTSHEVLKKIVTIDPKNPHKSNPRVPRDLSVICMKAMDKNQNHRYQTMAAFAEDLYRFLQGDVILAKPAGLTTRLWKRVKRNPGMSAAVGVALVAIVVFAVVVPWVIANESQKREELAKAAKIEIEKQRNEAFTARTEAESEKERALDAEKKADERYQQIMRLSDVKRLSDLKKDADTLWSAYPENIPGFEEWLTRAHVVLGRQDKHRQTLSSLRETALPYGDAERQGDRETHPQWERLQMLNNSKLKLEEKIVSLEAGNITGEGTSDGSGEKGVPLVDPENFKRHLVALEAKIETLEKSISERRTWQFEEMEIQWQHDILSDLVSGLEALSDDEEGRIKSIQERLAFATTIETKSIIDHQPTWEKAITSIANKEECPYYDGLVIEPKVGFVPIGRDPASGLWEFAHLQTGKIPERDMNGKLLLTQEVGLVFVLIPGGTFAMGAVRPSDDNPKGSPNVDPEADPDEGPVHEVTLKTFFLSKYEMTQGQWLRFTKRNPSLYLPGFQAGDNVHNLLHPVGQVSWNNCIKILSRLKLQLPTESEWEYSARAGTNSVYWTGDEKESLKGVANLADLYLRNHGGEAFPCEKSLNDGYAVDAPVGTFLPNAFGLHDVHGNVWEWCRDIYGSYKNTPTDGSAHMRDSSTHVLRGGCWNYNAFDCRSSLRYRFLDEYRSEDLGLRPACSFP